jgi:hypothetical protein
MLESEFMPIVKEWLEKEYPQANIIEESYLSTYRFVDFEVDFGTTRVMVEVENQASDVQSGIAQILVYTWNDPTAMGLVVYPKGTGTVDDEIVNMSNSVGVICI